MKRLAVVMAIVAASLAATGKPGLAGEETWEWQANDHPGQKDNCLIVAVNCVPYQDSLQERINRLNNEIAKGRDVYDADELSVLRQKLDRTYRQLDMRRPDIMFNPGYP
jgi:hypothetical protein